MLDELQILVIVHHCI